MNAKATFSLNIRGCKTVFPEPQVMGILNVTPDSFFAGSRKQTEKDIAERADAIIDEGGRMIDVGGYSTRPGASDVSEEEEMRRLRFALGIIRREHPDAILSVDTFRPDVAKMSVEEFGADIINDVSEGGNETMPKMFKMVAQLKVPYILMSVRPTLKEMLSAFSDEITLLRSLGHEDIILDPGYGFGKSIEQNYDILGHQEELGKFGLPLLVGASRKRMIWQLLGTSAEESLNGTTAVNVIALLHGANILRVHDVREATEAIKIVNISQKKTTHNLQPTTQNLQLIIHNPE